MLVKITISEWLNISGQSGVLKAGQEADGSAIYALVPDELTVASEVLDDIPSHIMQEVHAGRFGEYMDIATIGELNSVRELIGEKKYNEAQTVAELRLMAEVVEQEERIDQLEVQMLIDKGVINAET